MGLEAVLGRVGLTRVVVAVDVKEPSSYLEWVKLMEGGIYMG